MNVRSLPFFESSTLSPLQSYLHRLILGDDPVLHDADFECG